MFSWLQDNRAGIGRQDRDLILRQINKLRTLGLAASGDNRAANGAHPKLATPAGIAIAS
jgi:hypothetical protein